MPDSRSMLTKQELQRYLDHVRTCWDRILGFRDDLRARVDFGTVRQLELRNPCASEEDRGHILGKMETMQLFSMITDSAVRRQILERLGEVPHIIPSLHTFLEDTKWLEPCAKIMRSLLPGKKESSLLAGDKESTQDSFLRLYSGSTTRKIEHHPMDRRENTGSEVENARLGYLQLWMFAWRHFPELSGITPRKDVGYPKPQAKASNPQCLHRLAEMAHWLGFGSSKITELLSQDPDMSMARSFLEEARPKEFYSMSGDTRARVVQQIHQALKTSSDSLTQDPQRTDQVVGILDHRCGRPHQGSHDSSKSRFFFPIIYGDTIKELSYLSVNRDIFLAFFGPISGRPHLDQDCGMGNVDSITRDVQYTRNDVDQGMTNGPLESLSNIWNPLNYTPAASTQTHVRGPVGIVDSMECEDETRPAAQPSESISVVGRAQYEHETPPVAQPSEPLGGIKSMECEFETTPAALPDRPDTVGRLLALPQSESVGTSNSLAVVSVTPSEIRAQDDGAPQSSLTHQTESQHPIQAVQEVDLDTLPMLRDNDLYQAWLTNCKENCLMLVYFDHWQCYQILPDAGHIPISIRKLATHNCFLTYQQRQGDYKSVQLEKLFAFAKGRGGSDGVIYVHAKTELLHHQWAAELRSTDLRIRLAALCEL